MILLFLIFFSNASWSATGNSASEVAAQQAKDFYSLDKIYRRPLFVQLGSASNLEIGSHVSGYLGFGYQSAFLGVDIRGSYHSATYRGIVPRPDNSTRTAYETDRNGALYEKNSELARVRGARDLWSFWLIEPGVQYLGDFFPSISPNLKHRVRFGVGYGNFSDQKYILKFNGLIFSSEVAAQYIFRKWDSRVSADLGFDLHWGQIKRSVVDASEATRRLPIFYWGLVCSAVYRL